MRKLEENIRKYAELTPQKVAVYYAGNAISYSSLWSAIQERTESLRGEGLQKNRPFVFRASQDIDFIITYCAVHNAEAIAVPLEKGVSDEQMNKIREEVGAFTYAEDISEILYTTGTTGKAKGTVLSYRVLDSCADNFICDMGYSEDLLYIISGPLNHIASLSKIHPMFDIGGSIAILDGLKDMNALFECFNLPAKKFATFLVPACIRIIMQFSYAKLCALADKIDFIETGAAPISSADMEQLSKALPKSRLYNTLGGTEIGAVCTYDFNDGRYIEGCVGRPMKNAAVEIAEDGHLIISGESIMSGYLGDEALTAEVLIDGKIHSSDLGYIDDEGMIHLTGRKGDVINVGGFKVNPVDVENAAQAHPCVKDCICIKAKHPIIGTVLKLLIVLNDGFELDARDMASFLKGKLLPHQIPTFYEAASEIKRTFNGKIDRKSYL